MSLRLHATAFMQENKRCQKVKRGEKCRLTSRAGSRAFRPGQVVPGEAHLVVSTSCALNGHVELVAYSHVLLLEENLQGA